MENNNLEDLDLKITNGALHSRSNLVKLSRTATKSPFAQTNLNLFSQIVKAGH